MRKQNQNININIKRGASSQNLVLRFSNTPFFIQSTKLPNGYTLARFDIHLVGRLDIEGLVPFSKVSRLNVCTELMRCVNIDRKQELLIFGTHLRSPNSTKLFEE